MSEQRFCVRATFSDPYRWIVYDDWAGENLDIATFEDVTVGGQVAWNAETEAHRLADRLNEENAR